MNSGSTRLYNVLMGNSGTNGINNGIGRTAGAASDSSDPLEFFKKRGRSIENALGTTGASLVSAVDTATENANIEQRNKNYKDRLNNIAKKYGYDSYQAVWDARDAAEAAGDQTTLDKIDNVINPELKAQANANSEEANKAAENWKNYRENSYVGQKINQDRGKFAGSAINTLSTAADLTGLTANPIANAVQGGLEGVADELEQSGFENFDAGRAAQNAAIGATTGAVTGALNQGISNSLARRGGNLFKGNNAITAGLNNLGSKTALGRGISTIASGVGRGAVSGAVGGATGAGLSAAMNGQDVLESAVEGAKRGLTQGAAAGGVMAGANLALNNTPGVGKFMQNLSAAKSNWDNSGDTFDEKLTNTLNSGDSAVGNWLNRQSQSRALATMGNVGNRIQNVDTTTGTGDAWDRLAQRNGYNNYDEVIQRYMEANPGVELNPNGAAGQILTWLDENPNTPTTAAGWAKRAGERVLEDMNNRGAGLSIKNVEGELPEDIRSMQIRDGNRIPVSSEAETTTPQTMQNIRSNSALQPNTNETIDLTKNFENQGIENIQNRNKLQAVGKQLQNAAKTQKYSGIYDSLDSKTATRAAETDAPQRLADLGVKSQDYNEYAKTSSYVNKVVSDLAKDSNVKVNDPDLPSKLSADNTDVIMSDNALKKYNSYISKIVPDGDSPAQYSASYLLEKSRELGNKAANLRGNTDDVTSLRQALTDAKYTLRDVATDALERSGVTGEATNARIANGLKELGANQKVQDYYTEPVDGKSPSISDYIRRSSLFEQARDMGTQIDAEKYTRSASKAPTNPMTRIWRASGLDQPVESLLRNTVAPLASKATDIAGRAVEGVGNLAAKVGDSTPTVDTGTTTTQLTPGSLDVYNAIGRTEGELQGDKARTAQYLANATNIANNKNTLESMAIPTTGSATSLYNAIQPDSNMANQSSNVQQNNSNSYFQPTGDYWTDLLGSAITMAIDANDANAFASLYSMYEDALANVKKAASTSSETKLTDKQRQANAAARALNDFENTESNFAYDVSDIPVIGNIANFGGNEYASKAEALALQIGYMLSGATINKEEAKNIGMAYVPQPRDSEAVRRSKLAQLRGIISDYQSTYAE